MKSKAIFAVTLGAMLSVTAAAWTPGAFAQAAPANQAAAPASADLTDGEIRKVALLQKS
ncbi:TPA: hypothetical protein NHQ96_000124 [Pseudomonas aeruginosa]|nr:hypothetical protein [Pseudomonas aeruginosa]HCE7725634.1 hypothetical protein [Pseudomonas aeruginosa]HCE7765370.1 hypothetical protein [Pseudomonas aeruginosa]